MDFATSSGLAFAAGINAYLPLLSFAAAVDLWPENFHINPQFAFLTQGWCIVILVILTLADFFADKVPGLDHVWDLLHTVLRPVAGALIAAAASHASGGWLPVVIALGAGLAAVTHTTKASVRITSTVTTAGCMNIVLSFAEDVVAALSVLASLIFPYVMLVVVIAFVIVFFLLVPRITRTLKRKRKRNTPAVNQR
ncbi:MAG TPA: DUF4126 domain-containing protein [Ktedonobacteraceae bacterium]